MHPHDTPNPTLTTDVLLDPNFIEADGTASLNCYALSDDGTKLAYGISRSGSDWVTIYVRDVASKKDHDGEVIQWAKVGTRWYAGNAIYHVISCSSPRSAG